MGEPMREKKCRKYRVFADQQDWRFVWVADQQLKS
jgi:hypothetical protein